MKKIVILMLAVFLTLTSCGISNSQNIKFQWQADELYAVAYLGYNVEDPTQAAKEYLDFNGDLPTAKTAGEEWYLFVLRYPNCEVTVFEYDLTDGAVIGDKLLSLNGERAFLVCCNQSDIMPNTLIEIKTPNGDFTFSPYISLKGDGELVAGIKKGVDITIQ